MMCEVLGRINSTLQERKILDSIQTKIILKYVFSVKTSRFCQIYMSLFWASLCNLNNICNSLMVYKF